MTGRPYGGVPEAERVADRRRRLLDAGLELIGTRGVAGVTVGDISDEAGLTKRYFYGEFVSLDEFIDALVDDVSEGLSARAAAEADEGGADTPRRRVAAFTAAITSDPRLARIVLVETFGAGGQLTRLRETMIHRAVENLIADYLPPAAVARGDQATVQMTAYALSGACAELFLAWIEGQFDVSADDLVDYVARMFQTAAELIGDG